MPSFREQLLLQLRAEQMAHGMGAKAFLGDFGRREDRLEQLVEAVAQRRTGAGRIQVGEEQLVSERLNPPDVVEGQAGQRLPGRDRRPLVAGAALPSAHRAPHAPGELDRENIVDRHQHPARMGDLGAGGDVGNRQQRIAWRFEPQQLRLGANRRPHVIGVDGNSNAVKSIKAGRLNASVAQLPYLVGMQAVEGVKKLLAGDKVQEMTYVPTLVLTKEVIEANKDPMLQYVK